MACQADCEEEEEEGGKKTGSIWRVISGEGEVVLHKTGEILKMLTAH